MSRRKYKTYILKRYFKKLLDSQVYSLTEQVEKRDESLFFSSLLSSKIQIPWNHMAQKLAAEQQQSK